MDLECGFPQTRYILQPLLYCDFGGMGYCELFIIHYSLSIIHYPLFIIHYPFFINHFSFYILHTPLLISL